MNPADAQQLARRFIELPQDKRRLFLAGMAREGIDFAQLPMTSCVGMTERDGLSYAQQRMWFLWQLDPHSAAYNLPMAVRLSGAFQSEMLERAFSVLVARHEGLRTTFAEEGERTVQRVAEPRDLLLAINDLSALPEDQRQAQAQQLMQAEATQAFDLQRGPLLSIRLLRLAEQEHVLLLTLHHIIADGWSMNVLIDEFMRTYDGLVVGGQPTLPALAVQYRDYALWQRSWLEAGERERQLDYWRNQLGDEHPILELPTDRALPAQSSHRGARLEKVIDSTLRKDLKALAQRHGVTLFVVLLAAFKTLLHRYSGQTDIRVGGLIANRTRSETEGLIGFFVNTQLLRSEVSAQTRFSELLQNLREATLGAQANQELPFDALIEALQPARSQSHNPLFQVMFNHQPQVTDLQDVRLDCGVQVGYLSEAQLAGSGRHHAATSDLMLDTREEGEQLFAAFTYATDLFDAPTIAALAEHWRNVLVSVCADPHQTLGEVSMLGMAERERLIQPATVAAALPCVQTLFATQAARTPDALAVIIASPQAIALSYAELSARSDRLAQHLRARGVGPDVLVGVALGRSLELAVALLAVLKAGGAYVPLDPHTPAERLRHVLDDSGLKVLLTESPLLASLPALDGIDCLCLDQLPAQEEPAGAFEVRVDAHNLAYVIYTSGSTGRPKGVAVSHGALSEFIERAISYSNLREGDRVLQFATASFDGFVEQFFPPLCHGASVVLRDARLWDSATLHQMIIEHGITLADLPAAYWYAMVQDYAANPPGHFGALRQVHVGGEAMAVDGLGLWQRAGLGHVRLLNTYGPTEATVVSTIQDCSGLAPEAVSWRGIPIGHGLEQRRLYVLDDDLNLLPQGAVGELYIGGPGLARGYHRQPTLSAQRFIADPFAVGERLYRTGDRARLRDDGAVEYIGRVDHQVKIRGFRIELGEIQARLQQCPPIREALVQAVSLVGGTQLVAYLVVDQRLLDSAAEQAIVRQQLRATLQQTLPDYMVPSHFLLLPRLPLTPSGKLDRQALPAPDPSQLQSSWRAPHTDTEHTLAKIWEEVLQVPRVGLDDHFFELGGHSLLAAQVIARVKSQLGVALPLRSLFETPLLGELAVALTALAGAGDNDWSDMDLFMNSLQGVDV